MFETENMLFLKTLLKYFVILLLFLCAKWDYVGVEVVPTGQLLPVTSWKINIIIYDKVS